MKKGFIGMLLLSSCIHAAYAKDMNTLKNISFNDSGKQFRVVMDFSNPQLLSDIKASQNGKSLIVNLDHVSHNLFNNNFDLNSKIVKDLKIDEKNENTQLILSLADEQPFDIKTSGNRVELTISNIERAKSPKSVESLLTENISDTILNKIDFERTNDGQGQITIGYTSKTALFDVEEREKYIQFSFPKAKLVSDLFRKLDVKQFNTPIDYVISKIDEDKNMVIVKVYFKDGVKVKNTYKQNQRTLSLTVDDLANVKTSDKVGYSGENISFNFQDIPIKNVLQLVAQKMGVNLVVSDTVKGNITLRLADVPYDQALDIILKTKGLDKRVNGNVMLIAPFEDLVKREEQELNSKEKIKTILPLNHATIQIKYAKAKVMSEILKNFLSERGTIVFDERTNKLMVADTDERLMDVKKRVETLDIPIRQVVIEARIVFAKKNAQEELGVQWSGGVQKTGKNSLGMIGGNQQGLSDIVDNANQQRAGTGGTINPPNSSLVGLPVAGATSGIALGFLNKSLSLDVALSALEKSGDIEIVARPKIITADQKTATIESGKEYPYLELSDNGNSGVQFKQIVLSLAVTPQITPNDKILLDLKIVQDSVAELTNSGPAIDSTKMETQVLSNNGETIVLGGVFKSDIVKETEKTPILGDIPYLGRLFKKTVDREEKSELLLFITPRLVESEILPSE